MYYDLVSYLRMTMVTTVSTKGQVTIPRYVRDIMGIESGDKVMVQKADVDAKQITLKLIRQSSVERLAGSFHEEGTEYVPVKKVRLVAGRSLGDKYAGCVFK